LMSVPSATSSLGAAAKPVDADGLRGLSVPSIQVLNLGAVLQGLGIDPANLTVNQLGNALGTLGATLPNGTGTLTGAQLGALGTQLTTLQAATDQTALLSSLAADPTSTINGLLPPGTPLPATPTVGDAVTSITNQLKALDQSKSVGTQNGYVDALANLTGVHVAIAPLSSLTGGTAQAAPAGTIGGILGAANVPALSSAMQTLNSVLATTGAGALAQ